MQILPNPHERRVAQGLFIKKGKHICKDHDWENPRGKVSSLDFELEDISKIHLHQINLPNQLLLCSSGELE
jgi:hypothetical protein